MNKIRFQTYVPNTILQFLNNYEKSGRGKRADVGTESLLAYFYSYSWASSWCSIEELIANPDNKTVDRAPFKAVGYASKSYVKWIDTLPRFAVEYLGDSGRIKELNDQYPGALHTVRGHSLHLKRALIVYYKLCLVNPDILDLCLNRVRPKDFSDRPHNFQNNDYLFKYTEKIGKLINVDLSSPPKIEPLTEYQDNGS